jgi:DNA-directed RNA polymerase subunit RPC12/RpoP
LNVCKIRINIIILWKGRGKMVRCPKCLSEYYTITYVDEYDSDGDELYRFSKVKCDDCGGRFFIKEKFKFVRDENWYDYFEE